MGFETPTAGSVRVLRWTRRPTGRSAVARLGYVAQSTGLYRGLSVADHLDLAGTLQEGLRCRRGQAPTGAAGRPAPPARGYAVRGQASQLALCIALGTHAPVLLLGEPLASRSTRWRATSSSTCSCRWSGSGVPALLSSHIVSDVAAACDGLVVLGSGQVTLQGAHPR
ncbi:MAG: hypothetical protein R3C32_11620 [Chloroflexota bacterium]